MVNVPSRLKFLVETESSVIIREVPRQQELS